MNIINKRLFNTLSKTINTQNMKSTNNTKSNIIFKQFNLLLKNSLLFNQSCYTFAQINQTNQEIFEEIQNQGQIAQESVQNLSQYIKNPQTIQILNNKGIKSLFAVQIQTFKEVYEGRDILASDRTGSGKTIAYSLPIIEKFRDLNIFKSGKRQAKFMVLCPTRELALQVYKEISSLKHNEKDFNVVAIYGGASMDNQIRQLRNGVDIIVATPGRLIDLIQKRIINFSELEATCIDQADQMLEKGFKLDIEQIYKRISEQKQQKTQNLMFSATIPEWVDKISREYLDKNKKRVNLIRNDEMQTSKTVEHFAVECRAADRVETIKNLIKIYNPEGLRTIVFSQTKLQVTQIAMQFGKQASFLQGDMSQRQRQYNLNAFRKGSTKILIATDVASRGLDIDNVGLVIQLQPPRNTQPFIHRAGRTGRAGKKGISVTLFDIKKNLHDMLRIEQEANITFTHAPKPVVQESQQIWLKRLNKTPHQIKKINKSFLENEKLNLVADTLIASNEDLKELIKRNLILLAGEPPRAHSILSGQTGYKTYLLENKDNEKKLNGIGALNLLKKTFNDIRNVQTQTQSVIFDVAEDKIEEFEQAIKNDVIFDGQYSVRVAKLGDKEMVPLRELRRGNSRGGRTFEDKYSQNQQDPNNLSVFIPSLPADMQKEELLQILEENGVQSKSLRVKKKADDNVFAFVQCSDGKGFTFLLKNGLKVGKRVLKVYKLQNNNNSSSDRQSYQQNNGGRRQYQHRGRENGRDGGRDGGRYNNSKNSYGYQ